MENPEKLKQLLDDGVLTQEEYNNRREQFLSQKAVDIQSTIEEEKPIIPEVSINAKIEGSDFLQEDPNMAKEEENKIIEEERQTKEEEKNKKGKEVLAKKSTKLLITSACVLLVFLIAFFAYIQPNIIKPMKEYNAAMDLLEDGKYEKAKAKFIDLGNYKDAALQAENCEIASADDLVNEGKYDIALNIYNKYSDNPNVTADKIEKCKESIYQEGIALYEEKNYKMAIVKFNRISNYSDSLEYIKKCNNEIKKANEEKENAAKEAANKKAAEEKDAAEKKAAEEAAHGKLHNSLSDIMKVYMSEHSHFAAYSGSTTCGAKLDLYSKDDAYGGTMECSPSKNKVTVMFQGVLGEWDEAENAGINEIPDSIMTIFYFNGNPEKEDLMCMFTAEANLICSIDPSIDPNDATAALLDAYGNDNGVDFEGFTLKCADAMQSEGAIIFKVESN